MENTGELKEDVYCSVLSMEAGEKPYGTAAHAENFFLLEYRGVWGEKAFEESDISPDVKDWFNKQLKSIPKSKILLIKHPARKPEDGIRFYVASANDRNAEMFALDLDAYEDLMDLDLQKILAGEARGVRRQHEPVFTVCTNGRRDPCCAKFGTNVFAEMDAHHSGSVWQSTHVGGHRFAANVYHFPYGILYGRLSSDDPLDFMDTFLAGQVDLAHYRGRSCYPEVAQAGEHYLRQVTDVLDVDAFQLDQAEEIEDCLWKVVFVSPKSEVQYHMRIATESVAEGIASSCRFDKKSPLVSYQLLEYKSNYVPGEV